MLLSLHDMIAINYSIFRLKGFFFQSFNMAVVEHQTASPVFLKPSAPRVKKLLQKPRPSPMQTQRILLQRLPLRVLEEKLHYL